MTSVNVALKTAFFAEMTSNGFERLQYSFILIDDDDALGTNLWESNCYLTLLTISILGKSASISICDVGQVPYPVSSE